MYKGYPYEVHIDGKDTTVHDVDKLLMALHDDDDIYEDVRDELSGIYLRERQRYLDEHYEMTAERNDALTALERRLAAEIRRCDKYLERLLSREKEKEKSGQRSARVVRYHLEVDDRLHEECLSEEEAEFWYMLFEENRHYSMWGFVYNVVYCKEEDEFFASPYYTHDAGDVAEEFPTLGLMREKYLVAWEDIEKIRHLALTIEFKY